MGSSQPPEGSYHEFIPDLSIPRFTTMKQQDPHQYAEAFKSGGQPPWIHGLWKHWCKLYEEPYRGITTDGKVQPDLFNIQDEGVPVGTIVQKANALLEKVDNSQRTKLVYHIDSPEWRTWTNPEFLLNDKGLRLDEHENLIAPILEILKATLSQAGYDKAIGAMRTNHFLGELVKSPKIMNEYSYNFSLFGMPSEDRPWGFSLYGHHLCLNIFLYKRQIIISPWFTGAEPNQIDTGPYAGTRILQNEDKFGLQLMQSLSPDEQKKAQVYKLMKDPAMPWGRWNQDDQRHLAGAYRDNRIIPYEGILVSSMSDHQQELVLAILNEYLLYLPEQSRQMKIEHIKSFFSETYFCWIGGFENDDPFYYRLQSPVILVEFDHHSGVFLNNEEPAKFHIHTLLRTPNAGDYGMALRPLVPPLEQNYVFE